MVVRVVVYLCVFFSGGLVETFLWNRITKEVNRHLPMDEQYSLSIWAFGGQLPGSLVSSVYGAFIAGFSPTATYGPGT
jgi:hypothetical protein